MGLEQSNSYQRGETLLTLQPHGKLKWLVLIEGSIHQSNKKKKIATDNLLLQYNNAILQ